MTSGDPAPIAGLTGYGLLDGVTVVEVAHELTEYAGTMLAGLGAEVWLVEPPGGASTRRRHPFVEHGTESRRSVPFVARNPGKRSVVLAADDPDDRARFAALVAGSDVILEHESSPWAAEAAASAKPVVTITDPRHAGVAPIVVFAQSGSLSSSGWPHQPPSNAPSWLGLDAVSTFAAVFAIVLVRDQRHTGRVRRGQIPIMEAGIAGLTNWTRTLYSYGTQSAGQGAVTKRAGSGPFPVLPCADGYVRVIAATPGQWAAFVEWLDRPEVLCEPMWESFQFRTENYDVIFPVAAEILRDRSVMEVFHRGQALRLPVTPVYDVPQLFEDEHIRAREVLIPVDDPDFGPVRMLHPPLRTRAASDVRPLRLAPALGQDQADLPAPGRADPGSSAGAGPSAPVTLTAEERRRLPLAGIRVLTFSVGAVVPEATSCLAVLGAEVIKVESRFGLDFFRQTGGEATGDINQSPTFNQANLGVRSCAVNAGSEAGRAVLRSLVAECDILMENMRGPVMKRFGMDYPTVAAINPSIIYMSAQGLGAGPYETYVTFGPNLQSFAGMTSLWAHPDDPYPVGSTLSFPDNHAGKQGMAAVLAALVRRDRTGEGCYIDSAQFEVCLWSIADKLLQHQVQPGTLELLGNRSLDYAPHGCYPCEGEDQWCALAVDDDAQWPALVALVDDDRLRGVELATAEGRLERQDRIDAVIAGWTANQPAGEAVERLRAAGIPASIMIDGQSQANDRDLHERGYYPAIPHPRAGVRHYGGLPLILDGERLPVRRAPLLGEHTEAVLLDLLHVPPLELSRLVADEVVGT